MLSALAAIVIGFQGPDLSEWKTGFEVPGYHSAFVPKFLTGVKPIAIYLGAGGVRGVHPIVSRYVLHQPFAKVARVALDQMHGVQSVERLAPEQLERRGTIQVIELLPDRVVEATISRGKPVVKRISGVLTYSFDDMETDTRVSLNERPRATGRLPSGWPAAASHAPFPAKGFPGLPLNDLSRAPDFWNSSVTPIGSKQYWLTWIVAEDGTTLFPRLIDKLRETKKWRTPRPSSRPSIRCEPVDRSGNFVWLEMSYDRVDQPDLPQKGWAKVEVSWVDPSTGLGRRPAVG